jgi:hypothetical protein
LDFSAVVTRARAASTVEGVPSACAAKADDAARALWTNAGVALSGIVRFSA